jgi:prevent-host-death family protein
LKPETLMSTTTLSNAKKNLDSLLDEAVHSDEPVIIRREGKPDIALVVASELRPRRRKSHSDHVLRSPKNRKRIEDAFSELDHGQAAWTGSLDELKFYVAEETSQRKVTPKPRKAK